MDNLSDYTIQQLKLRPDYEGEVEATLMHPNRNTGKRKSVLYIHGFVDYFFHDHLAQEFDKNGFDFYALDMRKYGRSLLHHQHPNFCQDLQEYFEEISMAINLISKENSSDLYLLGHSTGGLISSYYLNAGEERQKVNGLILNSPFLDFNLSKFEKGISLFIAKIMGSLSKFSRIDGVLSPAYAQSLHKDHFGEWDFNTAWKPIKGFPTYFRWITAINEAQKILIHSNIQVPVLVMHSSSSVKLKKYSNEADNQDTVLNVADIKRVGATLGNKVTLLEVKDAKHDIFLSSKEVRDTAMKDMFRWLNSLD